jgi:hypothetical protein
MRHFKRGEVPPPNTYTLQNPEGKKNKKKKKRKKARPEGDTLKSKLFYAIYLVEL